MGRGKSSVASSVSSSIRSSNQSPPVTVHSNEELYKQIVEPRLPKPAWNNEDIELRQSLGIGFKTPLDIQAVFDRSGPLGHTDQEQRKIAEQLNELEQYGKTAIGLVGSQETFNTVNIYDIKPLGGSDYGSIAHIDKLRQREEYGGAPPAEGIRHATKNFNADNSEKVIIVVIDDSATAHASILAASITEAREKGIRVIGAVQQRNKHNPKYWLHFPEGTSQEMDIDFGEGNWFLVKDAENFPSDLIHHIKTGENMVPSDKPPTVPREPIRRLATAASSNYLQHS